MRTVAVGVGDPAERPALDWAAEEAATSTAGLVVLHACPSGVPLARLTGRPPVALLERADPELARAVGTVASRPGVPCRLQVLVGDPAAGLVAASADADLLVIGAGHTGSTAHRVVRDAHCPVVVVPPHRLPHVEDHVVVTAGGGAAACEFAFRYADRHGIPVTVLSPGPDDETLSRAAGYPRVPWQRAASLGTGELDGCLLVVGAGRPPPVEPAAYPVVVVPAEPVGGSAPGG